MQVENKAHIYVFVKCILRRCDESCMGMEIRLMFGRHIVCFVIGNKKHPTTQYKSLIRPILMNTTNTNRCKIYQDTS